MGLRGININSDPHNFVRPDGSSTSVTTVSDSSSAAERPLAANATPRSGTFTVEVHAGSSVIAFQARTNPSWSVARRSMPSFVVCRLALAAPMVRSKVPVAGITSDVPWPRGTNRRWPSAEKAASQVFEYFRSSAPVRPSQTLSVPFAFAVAT